MSSSREPDCLGGLALAGVLLALLFCYALVAHGPTPEERTNLADAMGQSTGVRWR